MDFPGYGVPLMMGLVPAQPPPLEIRKGDFDFEPELRVLSHIRDSRLLQETGGLGSLSGKGNIRGKYSVVCRHWLRDLCMKGEKCDFLHQFDLERMPECAQWQRHGRCYETDCEFKHDMEKADCIKYRFGFCKQGNQCRLLHDKLPRNLLPDVVPDWVLREWILNLFDFVPRMPEPNMQPVPHMQQHMYTMPMQPHMAYAQPPMAPPMMPHQYGQHVHTGQSPIPGDMMMQGSAPASSLLAEPQHAYDTARPSINHVNQDVDALLLGSNDRDQRSHREHREQPRDQSREQPREHREQPRDQSREQRDQPREHREQRDSRRARSRSRDDRRREDRRDEYRDERRPERRDERRGDRRDDGREDRRDERRTDRPDRDDRRSRR